MLMQKPGLMLNRSNTWNKKNKIQTSPSIKIAPIVYHKQNVQPEPHRAEMRRVLGSAKRSIMQIIKLCSQIYFEPGSPSTLLRGAFAVTVLAIARYCRLFENTGRGVRSLATHETPWRAGC